MTEVQDAGIPRDSREKRAGMRDRDPLPGPQVTAFHRQVLKYNLLGNTVDNRTKNILCTFFSTDLRSSLRVSDKPRHSRSDKGNKTSHSLAARKSHLNLADHCAYALPSPLGILKFQEHNFSK